MNKKLFLSNKHSGLSSMFLCYTLIMCWQRCERGTVGFKGVTLTIDQFERKGAMKSRRGRRKGELTNEKWQSCGELVGSLAAHRGDRAEATGLFHPFSHSAPSLPSLTPSCFLMLTHFVSHSTPTSLSPFLLCPISLSLAPLCLSPLYPFFFPQLNQLMFFSFLLHFFSPQSLSSCTSLSPTFFAPFSLYASPADSHVMCCCAVDKTQSLSHPSCTWDPWLLVCVCACMWERQWERKEKPQPSRMLNSFMLRAQS